MNGGSSGGGHPLLRAHRWHLSSAKSSRLSADAAHHELEEVVRDPSLRGELERFLVLCAGTIAGVSALTLRVDGRDAAMVHLDGREPRWTWNE
jgi:hypothetical protein